MSLISTLPVEVSPLFSQAWSRSSAFAILCADLMACNCCATSCITYFFHSCILPFLACSSWVAICLIVASAFLLARVATRVSCLIFSRFTAFPLAALRTLTFANWLLSPFPSMNWRCKAWCSILSCPNVVVVDASHGSGASFSMSLCSSMAPLPYTGALLTMTSKFFKSNIATKFKIRYAIKNHFSFVALVPLPV